MTECRELVARARGVILDFDGVIVDSERDEHRAWATATSMLRIIIERPVDIAGRLDEDIAHDLVGSNRDEAQRLLAAKSAALQKIRGAAPPALVDGVLDFVQWTMRRGKALAVASNSAFDVVTATLDAYGIHRSFNTVVAYGELAAKPSPAIYVAVLEQLGMESGEVVAIEDSVTGITAATRAGIACVGLSHGHSPESLALAGAACIVDRFEELMDDHR